MPDYLRIPDKTIIGQDIHSFKTSIQTGTGSAQPVAHGLGRVPATFFAYLVKVAATGDEISAVSVDGTNISVTCTSGAKWQAVCF